MLDYDELDKLPAANRENWLFELGFLARFLKPKSRVLQVGCGGGSRIIALLKSRPDLDITGLDIDKEALEIAWSSLEQEKLQAKLIEGDITKVVGTSQYDYVLCLNNTLGYIPQENKAVENMKSFGKDLFISVYGEAFDDRLAKEYFNQVGIKIDKVKNNLFYTSDGNLIKRFTYTEATSLSNKVTDSPVGYILEINGGR